MLILRCFSCDGFFVWVSWDLLIRLCLELGISVEPEGFWFTLFAATSFWLV